MTKYSRSMTIITLLLTLSLAACDSSSIDGEAQEERRENVETEHTSYPDHNRGLGADSMNNDTMHTNSRP